MKNMKSSKSSLKQERTWLGWVVEWEKQPGSLHANEGFGKPRFTGLQWNHKLLHTTSETGELHLGQNSGTTYKNFSSQVKSCWNWKTCSLHWNYHLKQQCLWTSLEYEIPSGWSWQGTARAQATFARLPAKRRNKKECTRADSHRAANEAACTTAEPGVRAVHAAGWKSQ